jgi:hypothetical protein
METKNTADQNDQELWILARKRVSFRNHFISYLACNIFFWALWYIKDHDDPESGFPWPLIVSISWGFGLLWHFLGAFVFANKKSAVQREYEKLKKKNS